MVREKRAWDGRSRTHLGPELVFCLLLLPRVASACCSCCPSVPLLLSRPPKSFFEKV